MDRASTCITQPCLTTRDDRTIARGKTVSLIRLTLVLPAMLAALQARDSTAGAIALTGPRLQMSNLRTCQLDAG